MKEEQYLAERLDDQISWYSRESKSNQMWFKWFRLVEIFCASLIPFLSGFSRSINYSEWIIGGLGLLIAISAAISSLYKLQENWIQYRTCAETLKHEKYLYLTKAAPYAAEGRFELLVSRVEAQISKENSTWTQYIRSDSKEDNLGVEAR